MFLTVKRLIALSLGTQREQLEQRMKVTLPRPFRLRPPFLLFFVYTEIKSRVSMKIVIHELRRASVSNDSMKQSVVDDELERNGSCTETSCLAKLTIFCDGVGSDVLDDDDWFVDVGKASVASVPTISTSASRPGVPSLLSWRQ
jgi:hypothetical protein